MLKELWIKNLAIVDDLKVGFEEGLNVLTGETGTGKSIIVDSLNLVFGGRASSDFVRSGEKEALIQAVFEVRDADLPNMGIDASDGLFIRRSISSSGKSRAYVNDVQVSMQGLAEMGKSLIDIHGQHEHQSLLSVERHRFFLDSFGRLHDCRRTVEDLYSDVSGLKDRLADLKQKTEDRARRMDFLRFQVNEIDASSLKAGEKEGLVEERAILSNLSRLKELSEKAYSMLYGSDGSCVERLSEILSAVREIASIDQEAAEIRDLLDSALPLIGDASVVLRGHKEKYDIDPSRLEDIEDRLELIRSLEKKYGEGVESILRHKEEAARELADLEHISERLDSFESELSVKEEKLSAAADLLSGKRREAAGKMETLIRNELMDLAFGHAEFSIDIRPCVIGPSGSDAVEFLFSANAGEQPKPLMKIASGGELSRVMLALKSIFAEYDRIPVLIFDEVDAGIGGKTAERVGERLRKLSSRHQVLCATHLPQIASMGGYHLKVEKREENGRVFVSAKEVSGDERLAEIARMLSGTITDVSLKHAKELLDKSSGATKGKKGAQRTARASEGASGLFS